MSHSEHPETIYRTSPRRLGKLLLIIIGVQVVGGLIFFSQYDFWNSYLPTAGKNQEQQAEKLAEQQAQAQQGPSTKQGTFTGTEKDVSLSFKEAPDFSKYGFNAPAGSAGANPEIDVKVGDKIVFSVTNGGKSLHAFAVTTSTTGPGPAIEGTIIGTADNPMKPGQSGTVTFVPASAGTYYYICAVPGHRELGMEGKIVVTGGGGGPPATQGTFTGKEQDNSLSFKEAPDFSKYGFNAPAGSAGANPEIDVKVGDKIVFSVTNGGKSLHAFAVTTSTTGPGPAIEGTIIGTADNPMKPGQSGTVTFVPASAGTYYYICAVPGHRELGMEGKIVVEQKVT